MDNKTTLFLLLTILFFSACTKKELVIVPDNDAPLVNQVPRIKIESFVNRTFIDLIGREPVGNEMENEVNALRAAELSKESRETLIIKLQTGTDFIEGDTSYQRAYYQHLYDLAKIRCLEGVADSRVSEFFVGSDEEDARLVAILTTRLDLQEGRIQLAEAFARMVHNKIYDFINMNSFNFVNATFDNLFWRFPSNAEFSAGFKMVEDETPQNILGQSGQSKEDYVRILTESREMFEGLILWSYQQLLSRRPSSAETSTLLDDFTTHQDIRLIQRFIMVSDEYANF